MIGQVSTTCVAIFFSPAAERAVTVGRQRIALTYTAATAVCVCARACVLACVRACVCVFAHACARVRACACVRA